MIEKENIVLKCLDKKVETLGEQFGQLKKEMDGRMLIIIERIDILGKTS